MTEARDLRRTLALTGSAAVVAAVVVVNLALAAVVPGYVAASHGFVADLQAGREPWVLVAVLALLAVGERTLRVVATTLERLLGERISVVASERLLGTVAGTEYERFEHGAWRDELTLAADTASFRLAGYAQATVDTARTVVGNVAVLGVLAALDVRLALAALASGLLVVPGLIVENRLFLRLFLGHRRRYRERHHYADVLASPAHAKDLRTLGLAPLFLDRYRRENRRWLGDLAQALRTSVLVACVSALGGAAALAIGYVVVVQQAQTPGGVPTAVAALTGFVLLAAQVAATVTTAAEAAARAPFVRRFWAFLDDVPRGRGPGRAEPALASAAVVAHGLSFAYGDGTAALHDVDLEVAAGEWVAVVGVNGAGKSTLLKLLAGLYAPTAGRVTVLGTPPAPGRAEVTTLWQDFVLFDGTVQENVAFGRPDAAGSEPLDVIRDHLAAAGLSSLATDEGLRLRLGALGDLVHELSGGQRQRLGLARASYRDGRLWLLDEPTAALDPLDAAELLPRLRARSPGSSGLVVTHHLGVAARLDRVLVLDGGSVVQSGSHDDLLAVDGPYRRLYTEQANAFVPGT